MTTPRSRLILRLLLDGKSRTAEEIAAELGDSLTAVRKVASRLKRDAELAMEPERFQITALGEARATFKPKTKEEILARKAKEWQERKRKREEAQQMERRSNIAEKAIANRHPLAMAWSANA